MDRISSSLWNLFLYKLRGHFSKTTYWPHLEARAAFEKIFVALSSACKMGLNGICHISRAKTWAQTVNFWTVIIQLLHKFFIFCWFTKKKISKTQCVLNNPFFYPLTQSNTTLRGARNVSCKHEAKNVNPQKRERFLNKCS